MRWRLSQHVRTSDLGLGDSTMAARGPPEGCPTTLLAEASGRRGPELISLTPSPSLRRPGAGSPGPKKFETGSTPSPADVVGWDVGGLGWDRGPPDDPLVRWPKRRGPDPRRLVTPWRLAPFLQGSGEQTGEWGHESGSRSVLSDSWQPRGLYSPWDSPDQNTGQATCPPVTLIKLSATCKPAAPWRKTSVESSLRHINPCGTSFLRGGAEGSVLGSDPHGYPIRPPGPRDFLHVSSKPRCQRRQKGPTSMD
ncbi:mitochondrial basic amino acids transporter isoform X4 [Moschus berezovskii]|uniref:mitochondrial basic amino acids transporter isoform X4 n=1 Tax=Moschus berezovskii TaxID=68408 RepID=UPI002444921C|nr:mitochondrial basic amino acids transporter isoform X4 [Moschus berezovskii]